MKPLVLIDYLTHEGPLPEVCAVINMPNDVYQKQQGISKSMLDKVAVSMAHLVLAPKKEPTRAMAVGTAFHTALLEPERFDRDYTLLPDVDSKVSSIYKAAVKEKSAELVLNGSEVESVTSARKHVEINKRAQDILRAPGWCEISLFARCDITGVRIRCRFDKLTKSAIGLDIKKTQSLQYRDVQNSIARYRYHVQDAFYSHVYRLVFGRELEAFKFLFIEEEFGANGIKSLDDEAKAVGQREFIRNIEYMLSVRKNEVPDGLIQDEEMISLPVYALDDEATEVEFQ